MTELPGWIRERVSGRRLGRGAERVVTVVDANPQVASYASTADVARRAGVNEATVVRTAQLLGFRGWPALRLEVRNRYLASLSAGQVLTEHRHHDTATRDAVRQDHANLESLSHTLDTAQIAAVAGILTTAHRTTVIGSGSFAAPGLQLAHLGQTMGYDIRLQITGGTSLLNDVALLGADDCLVVFSFWWVPRQIIAATQVAHVRDCTVIVISDRASTPFSRLAAHTVIAPSEGASLFPSLTAAMTVVHCILAEIVSLDEPRVRAAVAGSEALWQQNDLFDFS